MFTMKTINKPRKTAKTLLAISTAVLIAISALALTMSGTVAAPDETAVVLQCESGVTSQYTVEVGQISALSVGGLFEAQSGETSIATVAYTGAAFNNLRVTGQKAGVATIAYGTDIGSLTAVRYQVTDSNNISAYTIKDGGAIRFGGTGGTKPIPVEVVTGSDTIKWKSLNDTLATVDANTGMVSANKKGVTILIGEFTDKWGVFRDIHILVGIGVSLDGLDDNGSGGGGATGPESVTDGRILNDKSTGDGEWVEIARNGEYSLIIRKDFIKCYSDQSMTDYWNWYAPTVKGQNYGDPSNFLRQELNKWFNAAINGNTDGCQVLAKDARLRKFTVQNNAYTVPGTSLIYPDSLTDGFSRPAPYQTGEGSDIAFALSWSEAVNFCSISSRYRNSDNTMLYSNPMAAANYGKLNNLDAIYLRTSGDSSGMMSMIFRDSESMRGNVFQSNKAYIHPALWVKQGIFDLP